MANNGPGAPAAAIDPKTFMISGASITTGDQLTKWSVTGAIQGLPRFHLELTVYGPISPEGFLVAVAQQIAAQTSKIVRP